MWKKKEKNRTDGLHTTAVLRVSAGGAKGVHNKIFLLRMAVILLVALAGIISVGILAWQGTRAITQYLFFQNDIFRVRDIKIACDGEVVTPKHIVEYLELNGCSNIFAFNMAEAHATLLKKVPRIKSAEFDRKLPGDLNITIHERLPVARLQINAYYLVVDNEGYVLGTSSSSKILPIISGHELSGLRPGVQLGGRKILRVLDVLAICGSTPAGNYVKIRSVDVSNADVLDIVLADGEKVKLSWLEMDRESPASRDSLGNKLSNLADILRSAAARGKKIASVDMTVENNFPSQEY